MNNTPVHSFRYGKVSVAIWLNQTRAGVFYNVTASRSYRRDKDSDEAEWESSHSFSDADLPTLALAVQAAYHWIQQAKGNATTTRANNDDQAEENQE